MILLDEIRNLFQEVYDDNCEPFTLIRLALDKINLMTVA